MPNEKHRTRKNFTPAEVEFLMVNYQKMTHKMLSQLLPGHSPETICNKLASLGLNKGRKRPRIFTPDETAWIKENYSSCAAESIRIRFPSDDIRVISRKASAMGITRKVARTKQFILLKGEKVLTKVCSDCRKRKPIREFNKSSNNSSGFDSYCKGCDWEHEKKRRQNLSEEKKVLKRNKDKESKKLSRSKNPERAREANRRSYQLHKEERSEKQRQDRKLNPEKFKAADRLQREKYPDTKKANNLNRKAMHRALPHDLRPAD